MKKSTAVYFIVLTLSQLAARCFGQFLGAFGAPNANGGMGGYGAESTAMGMVGNYGYGSAPSNYGFGTAVAGNTVASAMGATGNCCNGPQNPYPPMPQGSPMMPPYQSPPIYGQSHTPPAMYPSMLEPGVPQLPHSFAPNFGSPYYAAPVSSSPHLPGPPGMFPAPPHPGMGYNPTAMAFGAASASAGAGGGANALAAGSASMGYGQPYNLPPSMPMPAPIPVIAQPQTLNENENSNTNININNDMGSHHSLLPKGLMGLARM